MMLSILPAPSCMSVFTHLIVNSFIANDFVLSRDGNGHIDLGNDEILYTNNGTQVAFVHNGSFTINVDSISGNTDRQMRAQ